MKMTLTEALEAISRGESSEQYKKRMRRINRLAKERDDIEDWLSVFTNPTDPADEEAVEWNRKRLEKVLKEIEELK